MGSGGFKGSRAKHLPQAPFSKTPLVVFRVYIFLIFGEKSIIHLHNILLSRS